jgi:hypothetical protein
LWKVEAEAELERVQYTLQGRLGKLHFTRNLVLGRWQRMLLRDRPRHDEETEYFTNQKPSY